jgi:hypothetical protein
VKQFRDGCEQLRRWRYAVERAMLKLGYSSELEDVGLSKRSRLGSVCNVIFVVVDSVWSNLIRNVQRTPGAVQI